jgi:hypothetical protein
VENLSAGIWLIFRGLNFPRNADIGQIVHLWMGIGYYVVTPAFLNPIIWNAAFLKIGLAKYLFAHKISYYHFGST